MKKILLTVALFLSLVASDAFVDIPLQDYAQVVAESNKINILIDKDLKEKTITFFFPADITPYTHFEAFKEVLKVYNLRLVNKKHFYVIRDIQKARKERSKFYFYHLRYINENDLSPLFSNLKLSYSYLPESNSVVFSATKDEYSKVLDYLSKIDKPKEQRSIQLTIFFTDSSKLKDIGSHLEQFDISLKNFLTILYPDASSNIISGQNVATFKTLLSYLVEHGYSQVLQKPSILLRDRKPVTFKVVKNIPYLLSKTVVTNNQTQNVQQYQYKDVGFNLQITPIIFPEYVVLDMNLLIENILSLSDTPITSKIELKDSFRLKKGDLLILSGFKQQENKTTRKGVPLLKDLPLLKYLFSYQKEQKNDYILTIFVEII